MKFILHNKIEITNGSVKHTFFNTMLSSVRAKYKNKQSFNDYLAIGTGTGSLSDFGLNCYKHTIKLETEFLQDDVSSSSDIFIKKTAVIDNSSLDGTYFTEAGITDIASSDPMIYNYFSLVSSEFPNGILKQANTPILISVYIYLEIENTGNALLTSGSNKFIDFLLGNGLTEKVYVCRGLNLLDNSEHIFREKPTNAILYEAEFSYSESQSELELDFSSDLLTGQTNEIVFLIGDKPFARINVQNQKAKTDESGTFSPKTNYVVDMGSGVASVSQITSSTTGVQETDTYISNYASKFGDKVSLPFYGMFNNSTPRFLSKDGKMIFFVSGNNIYGYKNEKHSVKKLMTNGLNIANIVNISSFDDFVFVFSKSSPYVSCFHIESDKLVSCNIDTTSFSEGTKFSEIFKADVTLTKNNYFIFGLIDETNHYGYAMYYTFNSQTKTFEIDYVSHSEYYFSYILAMIKNNFTDAMVMFLKSASSSYNTRLVYYYADKTSRDVYTTLAWQFTENTSEIYTKNRAVIIEKTTTPRIWVYFFPQLYRYTLSLFGNEENDYISTNLHYLIQKLSRSSYKIYNLVGYNTPTEFTGGFPSEISQSKILDFEFLNDSLLIFLDDENTPIVCYNLFEDGTLIENVSSNSDSYNITYKKYNLIGSGNEEVSAIFKVRLEL